MTSLWYASLKGFFPRLKHPRDFNEKLLAINLDAYHDESKKDILTRFADKYDVRAFVAERGLQSILNICYGIYSTIEDIDFQTLPNQFVLKPTNGSGQIYICKDKSQVDLTLIKDAIDDWLAESPTFGLKSGEWHYSLIQPRIIIENYLPPLSDNISLIDYKFLCIHGKVVGILVCYDRNPGNHQVQLDLYDLNWNLTDGVVSDFHKKQRIIPRPQSLEYMKSIAESLSAQIDFVRIDLYEVDGRPTFGEMTFTPAGNVMLYFQPWFLANMLKVYNGLLPAYDCLIH